MNTLKCTQPNCGLELSDSSFYKAPSNHARRGRDYLCIPCRRKQRKESRATERLSEGMSFCTGTCQGNRHISEFYVRAEYTKNGGIDYQCKQCRKEASVKGKKKHQKDSNRPRVDDAYIYCW